MRCAPCFTEDCRVLGITVSWQAVVEYDRELLAGLRDARVWPVALTEWEVEMEYWRERGGLSYGPPPVPHRDGERPGQHMRA